MTAVLSNPLIIDQPTTISGAKGSFGSELCVPHQVRSVDDLNTIGLIPRFIDINVMKRAVERAASPAFYKTRAESRLQAELDQLRGRGRRATAERVKTFDQARLSQHARDIQVESVAEALGNQLLLPIRRSVASRAVDLVSTGSYAVTLFQLDRDLSVLAPLIFDAKISVARVNNLRVRAGTYVESRAPRFVLHAHSVSGQLRSAGVSGQSGGNGGIGEDGGDGAPGRDAVCRDVLHKDQVPTDGKKGGDGGPAGDAGNGANGSNGRIYEVHLKVLGPDLGIDTSGGNGGAGGHGGKGGPGGTGGTGGDGKGCEPSGVGGAGGNGGKGGNGGTGGNGGPGADVYVYYVSDQSAGRPPQMVTSGGQGGKNGDAGIGGTAGEKGAPGPESKYGKRNWEPGEPGGDGDPGTNGSPGATGSTGENGHPYPPQKVPFV